MDIKRKYIYLLISIFSLLPITSTVVFGADNWPMFLHDQYNTGYTELVGPSTDNLIWSNDTVLSSVETSSPVIFNDNLFFKSHQNMLCLNASTGQKIWEFYIGGSISWSTPTIFDDKVYIGSGNGLFCLDIQDGTQIWNNTDLTIFGSSPVVVGGRVYIGAYTGIFCIDANNGEFLWNFTNNSDYPEMQSAPSVYNDKVYIQDQNWDVFCLDAIGNSDGTTDIIWTYSTSDETQPSGRHQSSPSVVDGRVYVGSLGKVFCLNAETGVNIWSSNVAGARYSSLSVANNRIFIGGGKSFYCLDALDGSEMWSYSTGETFMTSPAVADDKVYICSDNMYCLDVASGDLIWDYPSDYRFSSSPAISNGRAYFIAMNGKMYCFKDEIIGQLVISAPSSIDEDDTFDVTITSNGKPVENVIVSFNSATYTTDTNGMVSLTSPDVDQNTPYTITASKTRYVSDSVELQVKNVEKQIVIADIGSVTEGKEFQISLTADNEAVVNVQITFGGKNYQTNSQGIATLVAPDVEEDTTFTITASKAGYLDAEITITVLTSHQSYLIIGAPSSTIEGESYEVTITADDIPIENAQVTFLEKKYFTDTNGEVILTAPSVDENTTYTIIASKTGYTSSTAWITIINLEGGINGTVIDNQGNHVEDVLICITISNINNIIHKKCTFTDKNGEYTITVSQGTYTLEATKDGYITSILENIKIIANTYEKNDFTLTKSEEPSESLADYTVGIKIREGVVGGKIDIRSDEEYSIASYDPDVKIEINNVEPLNEGGITLTVSGDKPIGTKVVVYLGYIEDPSTIKIKYDGEIIKQTTSLGSFFREGNSKSEWAIFNSGTEIIVLVNVPEFSDHEINIFTSFFELPVLLVYVSACILAIFFIIGSVFIRNNLGKLLYRLFLF